MENKEIVKKNAVEEIAIAKIKEYQDLGMQLYDGFNPTNSLKKARFMLNDMRVNGKPVLEVCTPASVVQCLLDSVAKGLDFSEGQIFFIPRGNQMTTMESVYGRITRAKRASKFYKPIVNYVHEGDVFEFGVDVETGLNKIKKHETNLENMDKPIIAAYTYVTDNDGKTEVFIMTKKEWLSSWSKSANKCAVAKEFERDMIYRTIVKKSTKSLVNTNTNMAFAQRQEDDDEQLSNMNTQETEFTEFEEVTSEQSDDNANQIEEPKKQPKAKAEPKKDEFEDNDEF